MFLFHPCFNNNDNDDDDDDDDDDTTTTNNNNNDNSNNNSNVGALHAENWYEQPEAVTETDNVTILWDYSIETDRKIKANKPDITVKDKRDVKMLKCLRSRI